MVVSVEYVKVNTSVAVWHLHIYTVHASHTRGLPQRPAPSSRLRSRRGGPLEPLLDRGEALLEGDASRHLGLQRRRKHGDDCARVDRLELRRALLVDGMICALRGARYCVPAYVPVYGSFAVTDPPSNVTPPAALTESADVSVPVRITDDSAVGESSSCVCERKAARRGSMACAES